MKLTDLDPTFLVIEEPGRIYRHVDEIAGADGVFFLCPKCFRDNGGPVGTHSVLCWAPHVPKTESPGPGRWQMVGTGYADLTLTAASSSILLTGEHGCQAHFYVRAGEVVDA